MGLRHGIRPTPHHITLPMMGGLMGTAKKQSPETEKP